MFFRLHEREYNHLREYWKYILFSKFIVAYLPPSLVILLQPNSNISLPFAYMLSFGCWTGACVSIQYELFCESKMNWIYRVLYFIGNSIVGGCQGFCLGHIIEYLVFPFPYYFIYPLVQFKLPVYFALFDFIFNRNINYIPVFLVHVIGIAFVIGYIYDYLVPPQQPPP